MYQEHATEIQRECRTSPHAFRDVLAFVLATIQEPLERVPEHMTAIRNDGEHAPCLWGMKRQGYRDAQVHGNELWRRCLTRMNGVQPWRREACIVDIVDTIHGINTAKAGFVMQLAFGAVGCLDSHNLKRFGLNKAAFSIAPTVKRLSTKLKKAHAYVTACDELGGCEFLWNSWCDYVAAQRPEVWADGDAVSAAHACATDPF
jgi:hypothetical protein